MKVSDFINQARRRLVVVTPESRLREVALALDQPGVDVLVVATEDGIMQGVVTDSDLVRWISQQSISADETTAMSLMTRRVFSCTADQVLGSVVSRAIGLGHKHFPILSADDQPLGVVYISDALIALHKEDQLSADTLIEYIHGGGYR